MLLQRASQNGTMGKSGHSAISGRNFLAERMTVSTKESRRKRSEQSAKPMVWTRRLLGISGETVAKEERVQQK